VLRPCRAWKQKEEEKQKCKQTCDKNKSEVLI